MSLENRRDIKLLMKGFRLTTAEIIYHMPDHPHLLQEFIWQNLDLAPKFPKLQKFIDFWQGELDGPIHTVRVMSSELLRPAEFRLVGSSHVLH
jgi:uncharacterized protein Usg